MICLFLSEPDMGTSSMVVRVLLGISETNTRSRNGVMLCFVNQADSRPVHAFSKKTGKALKPSPVNNARDDRLLHTG